MKMPLAKKLEESDSCRITKERLQRDCYITQQEGVLSGDQPGKIVNERKRTRKERERETP
jgi:hypothetical protein